MFSDKYSTNWYVISSRPISGFVEYERFTRLSTKPFNKKQALELVSKLQIEDSDLKERFIAHLDASLYDKHTSFASNPLLLNIMLLTYEKYAHIPEKMHLFYEYAYSALFSQHDATKKGFVRPILSKLNEQEFRRVLSLFCFITYVKEKFSFTRNELETYLQCVKEWEPTLDIEAFIKDMLTAVCLMYKEGQDYYFVHRNFQEYFTAYALLIQSDRDMQVMATVLIESNYWRAASDSVLILLRDMLESPRFEKNVLLPIIKKVIGRSKEEDRYGFVFRKVAKHMRVDQRGLWLLHQPTDLKSLFLSEFRKYYKTNKDKNYKEADEKLREALSIRKPSWESEKERGSFCFTSDQIIADQDLYMLFKETWIGDYVNWIVDFPKKLRALEEKYSKSKSVLNLITKKP